MIEGMPSMREQFDAGHLVLCTALTQARTADIPTIAAAAGFDAVYVDLEHTAISLETHVAALCSAAIGARITPLVRVPSHDHQYLTRSLDVGAMGVIVPARRDPRSRPRRSSTRAASRRAGPPVGLRPQPREPLPGDAAAGPARRLRRADAWCR